MFARRGYQPEFNNKSTSFNYEDGIVSYMYATLMCAVLVHRVSWALAVVGLARQAFVLQRFNEANDDRGFR